MTNLNILSGGAAQGLVGSLAAKFKAQTGLDIGGDFGAVGAMADKLRAGAPADILILTSALIATLAKEGLAEGTSMKDVGQVETALAVRESDPLVSAPDATSLRNVFLGADAIFVPDTKASTAGIHVAKVLAQLGIADEIASRLKIYPNGATAMRHMAESDATRPVGCTQATEIIATKGIRVSGALPKGCELATVYTAAVTTKAAHAREAKILIELLTAADQSTVRAHAGFLPL
ncbi:MAG TPA: substrate-binding domain-containing protein [Bradyrhizobium sp.]|uniref:molybdate ABC transporter substrate-binding protein n=1 Tax=Bradyrhizobium sp. TaxID=376 RepID=UPI002D80E1A3|nr:substrate-binding domain-containing protein [Bradyrhizobium sp.]HET7887103.1 substrate-binding domain-containing protein [Bradyrhizobium sp.]